MLNKRIAFIVMALLLSAAQSRGQAELVRDIWPGSESSFPNGLFRYRNEIHLYAATLNVGPRNFSYSPSTDSLRPRRLFDSGGEAEFAYPVLVRDGFAIGYARSSRYGPPFFSRLVYADLDSDQLTPIDSVFTDPIYYAYIDTSGGWLWESTIGYTDSSFSSSRSISMRVYEPQARRWHRIYPFANNPLGTDTCYFNSAVRLGSHWLFATYTPRGESVLSYDVTSGLVGLVSNDVSNARSLFPAYPEYASARFGGRYFTVLTVIDSGSFRQNGELFEYLPAQRRLVRVIPASSTENERWLGRPTKLGNLLLMSSLSREVNSRAGVIAYEPGTGRHRRIASLSSSLQGFYIENLIPVGNTVYLEARPRYSPGVSSIFVMCRFELPAGFTLSDTSSTFEIRPVVIPALSAGDTLSFGLSGVSGDWLSIVANLSRANPLRTDVYALHLPTGRWLSTRSMASSTRGGPAGWYVLPVEFDGDLYFAAQRDDVGYELFRFNSDGLTPLEPEPGKRLFSLSPNPTTGRIVLTSQDGVGEVSYRVLNGMGQEIAARTADRATVEVELSRTLSAAAPGLYLVHLSAVGRSEVHRVLRASN